jgi:hypothetical protein
MLRVVVHQRRQAKLLEIVLALRAAGSLASHLHRRDHQPDKDADDGDDDEEFDEGEAGGDFGFWILDFGLSSALLRRVTMRSAWSEAGG